MVLNLKELNEHIPYKYYKKDTFDEALTLINLGYFIEPIAIPITLWKCMMNSRNISDLYEIIPCIRLHVYLITYM